MENTMETYAQTKSSHVKRVVSSVKRVRDTTVIKTHMTSLDNEAIKKALIASGMYDSDMKLTASFR